MLTWLLHRFLDCQLPFHFLGLKLQVYEVECGMHGAINLFIPRLGWLCWHPTVKIADCTWPWYFYVSPNGTPWASTVALGPGVSHHHTTARNRRRRLGLYYNVDDLSQEALWRASQ